MDSKRVLLGTKRVLLGTNKGYSAVLIGSRWNPFGFHVKTLSIEGSTWNPEGFYLETKRVLLLGQPNNLFGTLFSKSVDYFVLVICGIG